LLPRVKKPRVESEETRDILPTLGSLLNPANPVFVRQAAADALRNFMRLVSGEEPVRPSEPGVATREARPVQRIFDPEEKVLVAVRAVPQIARGLRDRSAAVRLSSIQALREVPRTVSELTAEELRETPRTPGATLESPFPSPGRRLSRAE